MSEAEQPVENNEVAPDADVEEESIFIKKEITVEMDHANGSLPQNANAETADAEEEKSAQPADEDRTEDQVPDITGTDYVDPMTTSMDGIEDLPTNEETQEYGDAIMEEDEGEHMEDDAKDQPAHHSREAHYSPGAADSASEGFRTAHDDVPALADDDVDINDEVSGEHDAAAADASATEPPATEADAPVTDDAALAEETPAAAEALPAEEAADAKDAPVNADEALATAEVPAANEPSAADGTSAANQAAAAEEVPVAEEAPAAAEVPVETFESESKEEAAHADQSAAADDALPPEEAADAKDAPSDVALAAEEVEEKNEAPLEGAKVEDQMAPPEQNTTPEGGKDFELQAPPEGKRPRTPNELDTQAEDTTAKIAVEKEDNAEEVPAVKVTAEPTEASQDAAPATPAAEKFESVPQTPKSTGGSIPPTPKSGETFGTPAGSVPPTPKSVTAEAAKTKDDSVPPTPKNAQEEASRGSVPPTPKEYSQAGGTPAGTPSVKAETPRLASPASLATPKATGTPKSAVAFSFDETPATPRADSEAPSSPTKTPRTPKSARTARAKKGKHHKDDEHADDEAAVEPVQEDAVGEVKHDTAPEEAPAGVTEPEQQEPAQDEHASTEEAPSQEPTQQEQPDKKADAVTNEEEVPPPVKVIETTAEPPAAEREEKVESRPARARAASPSPPRRAARAQSPSPERRPARDYVSYDQDSHRHIPPPRIPTATSFSSWSPPDKQTYSAVSPFVSNPYKYRNEYTASSTYRPNSTYITQFDDIVNTGPFSSALYSTTRLIERSRSRTRERRQAMRSQRSASNYYRYLFDSYSSQYPAPQRTREYSTPPSREYSRPPSRSGSFISFLEYSGSKNGELSRNASRSSIYDAPLSRSYSRPDLYVGAGRLSRVDSYVRDLHTPYEYEMPSTYDRYRSSSRSGGYSTMSGYTSYNSSPSYVDTDTTRRFKRYQYDTTPMIMSMYEGRIGQLERSLSRELINKDRLRTEYSQLSSKLNQALRQMELLRTNSYSNYRSSSLPRTSVYSHFYPYY
ncbi:unnamed protein product [Cylicocyclus nassatus]|uniref:Uncharacterized protein n=1 Tax=Cylicocyclus nassatus TaxID=53992 RepID=A0AA36HH87_CYLNA|nr:unnamed protein product [Cylicocyclus nassatus]